MYVFKYLMLAVIIGISVISVLMIVNMIYEYGVDITEKYQIKKECLTRPNY